MLETFARAFEPRTRAAYDGVRPYAQFLMGIARNVVLEQSRTREVVAGLGPQDEGSTLDWSRVLRRPESLEQQLEDREVEGVAAGFKEGLSAQERELFELRFTEGLAQESAGRAGGAHPHPGAAAGEGLKTRLLEFLQARAICRTSRRRAGVFSRGGARNDVQEPGGQGRAEGAVPGRAEARGAPRLREHAATCAECREQYRQLSRVESSLEQRVLPRGARRCSRPS